MVVLSNVNYRDSWFSIRRVKVRTDHLDAGNPRTVHSGICGASQLGPGRTEQASMSDVFSPRFRMTSPTPDMTRGHANRKSLKFEVIDWLARKPMRRSQAVTNVGQDFMKVLLSLSLISSISPSPLDLALSASHISVICSLSQLSPDLLECLTPIPLTSAPWFANALEARMGYPTKGLCPSLEDK